MIPFSPDALLVMLLTFYPIVGPAALLRARAERPDYFAGGEIRGSKGDKLWLADGRKYDLILATGSPDQRWQVLGPLPETGDPGVADPFALEDGPLVPFDLSAFQPPASDPIFGPIVAEMLDAIRGHATRLDAAHDTLAAAGASDQLIDDGDVDTVDGALQQSRYLVDAADPGDVAGTTAAHGAVIDARQGELPDAPPDAFPGPPGVPPAPPDVQQPTPIDSL